MNTQNTWCNPLPLPDYPRGVLTRGDKPEASYRETADPSVLYENGVWYMYCSGHMAYTSRDFIHWEHTPIEPEHIGYAPCVVRHGEYVYLMANVFGSPTGDNPIYRARDPLGPFEYIGSLHDSKGNIVRITDPMLFSDEGKLYLYYGGGADGIYGVEVDGSNPSLILTEPVNLLRYHPENVWERIGEWNEDKSYSWIEGACMYKRNGRYYLTYSAPATEYSVYAMGAYVSDQPLSGFVPQKNNPFAIKKHGLLRGSGHGCVADGPNGTIWAFYTSICNYFHSFERIVGMDEVFINADGELECRVTGIPQPVPGSGETLSPALIPVSFRRGASASSSAPGRDPIYALDDSVLSWWQPDPADKEPMLEINLKVPFDVCAVRLLWREVGLDYPNGALPEPIRYRLEGRRKDTDEWTLLVDQMENTVDRKIDYRTFDCRRIDAARLYLCPASGPVQPGLISITLFGGQFD